MGLQQTLETRWSDYFVGAMSKASCLLDCCMLNFNELPLWDLFKHCDGAPMGPTTFTGPIGSAMESFELKTVVQFQLLNGKVTPVNKAVYKGLSNDQKYLNDICLAVQGQWVSWPQNWHKKSLEKFVRQDRLQRPTLFSGFMCKSTPLPLS